MSESVFTPVNLKFLGEGLLTTLYIASVTIILSVFFGVFLAVGRNSRNKLVNTLCSVYINFFRNIPNLLVILAMRFIVPIHAVENGILSMTLFTSAVIAEIIRGGLNSIKTGQYEAAYSQGFSRAGALRYIILPQAIRNMLPSLLSQLITVIKDTSFLWAVGIEELTGKGMIIMGRFASSTQIFLLFALLLLTYFTVNFLLSLAVRSQRAKY
jgi:aspartate/glutamate/glutamine transport system permease protein